jgi:hypothetical protein
MARSDSTLLGAFNDVCSEMSESPFLAPAVRVPALPSLEGLGSLQPAGLGGGVRTFPYADLIREHLAHGRILAARNLMEFSRDLLPPDSTLVRVLAPPKIRKSDRLDIDRSAEFRWLQANSSNFRGQWVALVGESLAGSAATLAELLASLKASPPPSTPLIHHLD